MCHGESLSLDVLTFEHSIHFSVSATRRERNATMRWRLDTAWP
jgi:hypothetical protein